MLLPLFHSTRCSPARVVIAPASYGSTPLILAARCGHLETVTALLRHGATASDGLLATISHYAQLPIPAVSRDPEDTSRMDLLRLQENLDEISRAVRRALLKQRYDADYDNIGC
jgi:ankyrin repeat protein